ncbi:hypothetical protein IscW_ISCW014998 [Ixodes scapularis]|uniref:Secreted protein n=1 Tax=Ixodes scapularis TaxID=6945 RepID=B7QHN0_IXOSC|nr:hypothetical protein IscW_ISCW014998 [Ixodes scapularis]|eukprot:XP_002414687.1 hypothetical protein IscW_ISCW014998 [Ixodes scapularis]
MPSSRPLFGCCTPPSFAWRDVLLVVLFNLSAYLPGGPVPVASPQMFSPWPLAGSSSGGGKGSTSYN